MDEPFCAHSRRLVFYLCWNRELHRRLGRVLRAPHRHGFWHVLALTPSFFWGALLLGRALAPALLRRVRETTLASAGLVLASLGVLVLLIANSLAVVVVAASVAGLGLASVFPINIAMLSQWFGEMASHVGPMMFALSSLGGATVPWLVGALSSRFGSLRVGLTVPLLGSVVMLFLYLKNRHSHR